MSQTQIEITTGVTTHYDVLNLINSNSLDAENRVSSLELVSGQGGAGDISSGDNISLLNNDAGYLDEDGVDSIADENVLIYDPSGVSADAFDFDNFHSVPDFLTGVSQGSNITVDNSNPLNPVISSSVSEQPVTPQVATSSSNILQWDHALGSTIKVTLTEDIYTVAPNNVVEGDSGLIIVEQDGTSNWTVSDIIGSRVLVGDLAVIGTDMTSATNVCTIGWYLGEGNIKYLYVSDVADQA